MSALALAREMFPNSPTGTALRAFAAIRAQEARRAAEKGLDALARQCAREASAARSYALEA